MLRVCFLAFLITVVTSKYFCSKYYLDNFLPMQLMRTNELIHKDAQKVCVKYGGKLINFNKKEKWDAVYDCHVKNGNRNLELWTGATNHYGEWMWENLTIVRGVWCSAKQALAGDNVLYSRVYEETGCFKSDYSTVRRAALCEYSSAVYYAWRKAQEAKSYPSFLDFQKDFETDMKQNRE